MLKLVFFFSLFFSVRSRDSGWGLRWISTVLKFHGLPYETDAEKEKRRKEERTSIILLLNFLGRVECS